MTTSTRMVGSSLLAALALAAAPVLAGAVPRGAPGGPLVVEGPPREGWPEADVEDFLEACQTALSPAACGCLLAELEETYDDFAEFRGDESEGPVRAAIGRCAGLLPKG